MILVIQIPRGKAPQGVLSVAKLVRSAGQWPQLDCCCARPTQDLAASCRGVLLPTSWPLCWALGIFRVGRRKASCSAGNAHQRGKASCSGSSPGQPQSPLTLSLPWLEAADNGLCPILESRGALGDKEARACPAPHAQGQHLAFLLQGCTQVGPFPLVTSVSCGAS